LKHGTGIKDMTAKTESIERQRKIPSKPIDPVGSILNHLLMVLIIVGSILILGSSVVLNKVKPFFSTNAIIKIDPVIPKVLYGKEEASITPYYDDFVRTQINVVKSYPVLSKAIEIYHEKGFIWQTPEESMEQAVGKLTVRLKIEQLRDTQLFSLSMTSRRKAGLAEIVNAVAIAYLDANRDKQLNKDTSRLKFLRKRKEDIEKRLSGKYAILQLISAKYAVGITDEKNIYVYLQAVVDLSQQLVKATSRRIQVESKLKELEKQMGKLKYLDISADVDEWIENDSAIQDNRIQLSRKLQDMRLFLAGVNEDHPDRKEYEEGLEKLYEVQESLISRAKKVGGKVLRGKLLSDQNKKILELETEYAAALKTEEKLHSELLVSEKKATDVNTQMMKASTLRRDIQRLQDALLRIDERTDQIEAESRSPGRLSLMAAARTPNEPTSGKRAKLMIVVFLFSLMSGIGYAIGKDKLDNSIYTPLDIERVLGFPVTGHIMESTEDKKKIKDTYRVVLDHPFSLISEQYKEISFALAMEHDVHKSNIYSCVSISQGGGTSTFLVNTLCAMKGHRKKKILVDLNVWNPISKAIAPGYDKGLWEVLEGKCSLQDAIITESDYPFHILPFGDWQHETRKSVFQEIGMEVMIETLRMDYEYIMIDSPPLGLTTDAKFLAQLADVAILNVNTGLISEKQLFRAAYNLDKVGVKVISVVLNRVKFQKGKYYKPHMEKYYHLINRSIEKVKK
jgi:polysaccharide biosynthesis transport protein